MKRADEFLFTFTVVSSSLRPREFVDAEIHKIARETLRERVISMTVKEEPMQFSRKHTATAYIVPADEFWRLVEREAMELSRHMVPRDFSHPLDPGPAKNFDVDKNRWTVGELTEVLRKLPPEYELQFILPIDDSNNPVRGARLYVSEETTGDGPGIVDIVLSEEG